MICAILNLVERKGVLWQSDKFPCSLKIRRGTLVEVTSILGASGINIRAVTVADTTRFGILRLIVDKPELAEEKTKK